MNKCTVCKRTFSAGLALCPHGCESPGMKESIIKSRIAASKEFESLPIEGGDIVLSQYFSRMAELIDEKFPELRPVPVDQFVMSDEEAATFERFGPDFGKHQGKRWSEVDSGYLEWMMNKNLPLVRYTKWRILQANKPSKDQVSLLDDDYLGEDEVPF